MSTDNTVSNPALQDKLLQALDGEAVLGRLREICRIPSVTGQEQRLGMFLARKAEEFGFDVRVYELRGYGVPSPGRPNVVFRIKGRGTGPALMLNAHLDTEKISPLYDALGEDPYSGALRDGYIYGLGVYNAKAPAVAFLYAMKALREVGFTPSGDIVCTLTVGEMDGASGPRYLLTNGVTADMLICGLPTGMRIPTAHVGVQDVRIVLKGRPAHMAWAEQGIAVAPKLARLIDALPRLKIRFDPKWTGILEPRWNISHISGGHEYRTGVLLDECALGMSFRAPAGTTPEMIREDLEAFLADLGKDDPEFRAGVLMLNPIPANKPGFEISPKEYVVKAVARAHEAVTGAAPFVGVGPIKYSGSDATVIRGLTGMPAVIYGAGGEVGVHGEPERVKADEVVTALRVYALAMLEIGSSDWETVRPYHRLPV